jgi:hypothetical protein
MDKSEKYFFVLYNIKLFVLIVNYKFQLYALLLFIIIIFVFNNQLFVSK